MEPYDLADRDLYRQKGPPCEYIIWQPQEKLIVIGKSDKPEGSVHLPEARKAGIKILQRPSGGHAVVLSPQMIAISFVQRKHPLPVSKEFFKLMNNFIITALEEIGVKDLSQRGISDIAIGQQKICGSAVYRNAYFVFFHAILNVGEAVAEIGKYLQYPARVPDYRNGRTHEKFVTSLWHEGYLLTISETKQALNDQFSTICPSSH